MFRAFFLPYVAESVTPVLHNDCPAIHASRYRYCTCSAGSGPKTQHCHTPGVADDVVDYMPDQPRYCRPKKRHCSQQLPPNPSPCQPAAAAAATAATCTTVTAFRAAGNPGNPLTQYVVGFKFDISTARRVGSQ